jgi:hypothetical protein
MKRWPRSLLLLALFVLAGLLAYSAEPEKKGDPKHPGYEYKENHDPDGIGKFYMGREIAQVMGHQAAEWLERPEREREEQPSKLVKALKIQPGEVIADIGAGTPFAWPRSSDPRARFTPRTSRRR